MSDKRIQGVDAKTIKGALSRKHHSQLLLIDCNPTGFRLKRATRGTTEEYRSADFVGVFKPATSLSIIERELAYQAIL